VKFRRISALIARSPRLSAVFVWLALRRRPEARPGLRRLLTARWNSGASRRVGR